MASTSCPENNTGFAVFLILGFHSLPALKPFLFVVFLTIYLFIVAGNMLILVTVASDVRLHSPMYFFVGNLSFLEIWYTTSIVPTLLGSHLGQELRISQSGCLMQFSLFCWFTATECFLLTVMSYDRYLAICHPLRYTVLMNQQICIYLATCTCLGGILISLTVSIFLCMLQFPKNNWIDHFFCDLSPIVNAACSDTSQIETECFFFSIFLSFPFMLVFISYVFIIFTILKIPTTKGKKKAFSTCSSHLTIVIAYFGILTLVYTIPTGSKTHNTNKAFSLLYTVGTPLFNPVVYSLRNKEMKEAVKKYMRQNVSANG